MDVSYINPFLEASSHVIKEIAGFEVKLGKLYLKTSPYRCSGVVIIVGITGKIRGQATLSMDSKTALHVVSEMMMGASINELDELAKSALGELANMILGNSASIFYKRGITIDITPPSILTGENLEISCSKQKIVCVPMAWGDGTEHIDIDIAFMES
jgi:chemotaxis protein CheX